MGARIRGAVLVLVLAASTLASRRARADELVDAPQAPPNAGRPQAHLVLAGGLAYGQFLGLGARTTALEVGVAVEASRRLAMTFGADLELGKTSLGELPIGEVATFATLEALLGRVRLGAGPQVSYFRMSRATSTNDQTIDAIGLGMRARFSVDFVRFDDGDGRAPSRGLVLAVSPSAEWLRGTSDLFDFDGGAIAWRATATLGLRF